MTRLTFYASLSLSLSFVALFNRPIKVGKLLSRPEGGSPFLSSLRFTPHPALSLIRWREREKGEKSREKSREKRGAREQGIFSHTPFFPFLLLFLHGGNLHPEPSFAAKRRDSLELPLFVRRREGGKGPNSLRFKTV